jgi:hypothetical protein
MNKESDTDWFTIQPQDGGKRWTGKCWCGARGFESGKQHRAPGRGAGCVRCCLRVERGRTRRVALNQLRQGTVESGALLSPWNWLPRLVGSSGWKPGPYLPSGQSTEPGPHPPRYVHNYLKYEFDFQFDVPATYPAGVLSGPRL